MSRRNGEPRGFTAGTTFTNSPSNNSQNARPMLDQYRLWRETVPMPLWPHNQTNHPDYVPARKGEIAFKIGPDPCDPETSAEFANPFDGLSSFNSEVDTILYYPCMNGFGDRSAICAGSNIQNEMRKFKSRIRPLGPIVATIEKAENLQNLPNTILVSKGKQTVTNTGPKTILDGHDVSVDIPIEGEWHTYGMKIVDGYEPNRMSLLTVPTITDFSAIHDVQELLDASGFRNAKHMNFVTKYLRAQLGLAGLFMMATLQEDLEDISNNGPATFSISECFLYSAVKNCYLSLDEDDPEDKKVLDSMGGIATRYPHLRKYSDKNKLFNILCGDDLTTTIASRKSHTENMKYISSNHNATTQLKFFGDAKTAAGMLHLDDAAVTALQNDLEGPLVEHLFDLSYKRPLMVMADCISISQRLKIGRAMTPAQKGQDFDLALVGNNN